MMQHRFLPSCVRAGRRPAILLLAAIVTTCAAPAQSGGRFFFEIGREPATPLEPADPWSPALQSIGLHAGALFATQSGVFEARCGTFDRSSGVNPDLGIAWEIAPLRSARRVSFELLLAYRRWNTRGSYELDEPVVLTSVEGEKSIAVGRFEDTGYLLATSLSVQPSVRYQVIGPVHAGLGASVDVLFNVGTRYVRRIVNGSVVDASGRSAALAYAGDASSDPSTLTYPDEGRDDAAAMTLHAVPYVDCELIRGEHLRIAPRVSYALPIGVLFEDVSAGGIGVSIGVRYVP